jgi:ribosomal-protein-alanine N-acetyltransferase
MESRPSASGTLPLPPLRLFSRGDAAALVRHANDHEVWRFLRDRFPHPYTRRDAEEWLRHVRNDSPPLNFAIEEGGEAVGGIGLIPGTDVDRVSAEVGYWLGRGAWGRGLATRAVTSLTAWAFATFDLARLFATPFSFNPASARVLEKAGWRREGVLRNAVVKEGRIADLLVYGITRGEAATLAPLGVAQWKDSS